MYNRNCYGNCLFAVVILKTLIQILCSKLIKRRKGLTGNYFEMLNVSYLHPPSLDPSTHPFLPKFPISTHPNCLTPSNLLIYAIIIKPYNYGKFSIGIRESPQA